MMDHLDDLDALVDALRAWAAAPSQGWSTGGGRGGAYDYIELYHRPEPGAPKVGVVFHAELVGGRPVILVRLPDAPCPAREADRERSRSSHSTVVMRDPGLPDRDPSATCDGCGVLGTVGYAARTRPDGTIKELYRFCFACLPEQSARYRARWNEETRRAHERFIRDGEEAGENLGTAFGAATWHNPLEFVREIETAIADGTPVSRVDLARIAAEIREHASELEGEMPLEVERFLRRYGADVG